MRRGKGRDGRNGAVRLFDPPQRGCVCVCGSPRAVENSRSLFECLCVCVCVQRVEENPCEWPAPMARRCVTPFFAPCAPQHTGQPTCLLLRFLCVSLCVTLCASFVLAFVCGVSGRTSSSSSSTSKLSTLCVVFLCARAHI